MQIKSLCIRNFRNYAFSEAVFSPAINALVGENAAGKTNMLEAVYLAGLGRSPRTSKDKELVKSGEEFARVSVELGTRFRTHKIDIKINGEGKKKFLLDGIPLLKIGELLGVLNIVYFSPDEMKLVKESPEFRRRFLDISLSQQQRVYFTALSKYNKILKQRNNLLKNQFEAKGLDDMLDVWDEQLAEHGAVIVKKRVDFINQLQKTAKNFHFTMSEGKETLELSYETDVFSDGGKNSQNTKCSEKNESENIQTPQNGEKNSVSDEELFAKIAKQLLCGIKQAREKDKKLMYTTVGPHRDDMKIVINGADVRKFASQGQQRTTALALKLGEMELFKAETGEYPVLLLDDVLSELDENRRKLLLKAAFGAQVILTGTEFPKETEARIFYIKNGAIVK